MNRLSLFGLLIDRDASEIATWQNEFLSGRVKIAIANKKREQQQNISNNQQSIKNSKVTSRPLNYSTPPLEENRWWQLWGNFGVEAQQQRSAFLSAYTIFFHRVVDNIIITIACASGIRTFIFWQVWGSIENTTGLCQLVG